jgi:uracil-DNA glycosylase
MIGNNWDNILKEEFEKDYFKELMKFVSQEYKNKTIYPKQSDVFNAFRYTDFDNVKVVILGQDPYHGPNQAEGLSFSVSNDVLKPPSLKNIFKELESDSQIPFPEHNSLKSWAKEGVLLLNAVLTVEEHNPISHKGHGWETFTDDIIKIINNKKTPVVFILWGSYARNKKSLITNPIHYVIESPHPSPFSAYSGFFGSKPFSKTNNFLKSKGLKEINWRIE